MIVNSIIRRINRGGFGIVEEVICDDGNHYARKTFSPNADPRVTPDMIQKWRQRFIREVETQKRLPSEYVIPVVYYELNSLNPWYLMPVADYDYNYEIFECKSNNRKPDGLSDILNSLEYIHNLGLVHRDLKPGNILFHEGLWKLSDFGLISKDSEIFSESITSSDGVGLGSEPYIAPEQITGFKYVDKRADIYSFGAILHDIFGVGKRTPYSNVSCPGDIGFVVDKCTKREPRQRFRNVESLRTKLLYLLAKDSTNVISTTLQNQLDNLSELANFDVGKFEDLLFYIKDETSDKTNLFYELNEEIINHLYNLEREFFIEFCLEYVEWVKRTAFQFDYCDVIIRFIYLIYQKTESVDLKAKSVISAAELGRSHNRWYVMENVVKMANKEIGEGLAFRLQIDIDIDSQIKSNFLRCVAGINRSKNSYHDLIADIL